MDDIMQSDQAERQSDDADVSQNDQAAWQSDDNTVAGTSSDELEKKYKSLQADYTRKTQELSELKRSYGSQPAAGVDQGELSQMADVLLPELRKRGMVTEQDYKLDRLLDLNPDINAKVLRDLADRPENQGRAYEDIIADYDLKPSDKLIRAKSHMDFRGEPIPKEVAQSRSIQDLGADEWEKERVHFINSSNRWKRSNS